jgi:hypothetical protein
VVSDSQWVAQSCFVTLRLFSSGRALDLRCLFRRQVGSAELFFNSAVLQFRAGATPPFPKIGLCRSLPSLSASRLIRPPSWRRVPPVCSRWRKSRPALRDCGLSSI